MGQVPEGDFEISLAAKQRNPGSRCDPAKAIAQPSHNVIRDSFSMIG
jgi:hypothetical protein